MPVRLIFYGNARNLQSWFLEKTEAVLFLILTHLMVLNRRQHASLCGKVRMWLCMGYRY